MRSIESGALNASSTATILPVALDFTPPHGWITLMLYSWGYILLSASFSDVSYLWPLRFSSLTWRSRYYKACSIDPPNPHS